jgi:hypothetical protein
LPWRRFLIGSAATWAGTWLARSLRSGRSGSRVGNCLSGLFAAAPRKDVRDPLGGGVSPKRVAARLRLAEEFGLGSVSAHHVQRRRAQARRFRAQQFSRRRLLVAKMMRCAVAGSEPAITGVRPRFSHMSYQNRGLTPLL